MIGPSSYRLTFVYMTLSNAEVMGPEVNNNTTAFYNPDNGV